MQEWYIYFVCGKGVLFREVSSVSNRVVPLYIILFVPCRVCQKYTELGDDLCLYSKVVDMLSSYHYNLLTRRFIQSKFQHMTYDPVSVVDIPCVFCFKHASC